MICQHCQAEVQDLAFCPHCGYRLREGAEYPPQEYNPLGEPSRRARRGHFFRRWVLPFLILIVVIAFGVLGMALMGFRDGSLERDLANQHQAEIHYNRGLIYLEWGQYELAEAEFEEAVRLAPYHAEAEERRRLAQVRQTVTPSPTASPSPTPTATPVAPTPTREVVIIPVAQVLFEEGQAHFERAEWEQAISKLEQLRREDVTYRSADVVEMLFQSHKNYGIELDERDNLEEAITHYDSALYLRRREPEIEEMRRRADLYMKALGVWNVDWESVTVNLTALYALAPDYKDTAQRLYQASTTYAQMLVKQERYCAAAELAEQALEIRNDDPELAQLEDDARHICQVVTPVPLESEPPNGSLPGQVHLGTIVASCYDHRTDQFDLCAQDAEDNLPYTWLKDAEQPALTLDGKWLAYRSTDPDRPGLYASEVLTTAAISDTTAVNSDTTAAISSTLAGATAVSATVPSEAVVLGTVITLTTEAEAYDPTWSPDGTRVAYTQHDPEKENWFIYLVLVGSEQAPRLIHQGEWPTWGPNGLLAFTTCSDGNECGIHIFDPRSWTLRKLTSSIQDRASGWSPSGDEIVYMSDIGRSFNLYVVHTGSGHVRQITRNLFTDVMPVWSPDGQRIAYVTNRDDDWALYTLHPYGDQEKRIASLGAESANWQRFRLAWVARVLQFPSLP